MLSNTGGVPYLERYQIQVIVIHIYFYFRRKLLKPKLNYVTTLDRFSLTDFQQYRCFLYFCFRPGPL